MPRFLAALAGLVLLGAAPARDTFSGTISDSMCAESHAAMKMGPTDAACTDACIDAHGATYVLVDGTEVYGLSDQRAPKAFAGKKVKVLGSLDPKTHIITVTSITASPAR